MATIYTLADEFRAAQLAREDATLARVAAAWAALEREVQRELAGLDVRGTALGSRERFVFRDLSTRLEAIRARALATLSGVASEVEDLQATSAGAGAADAAALVTARTRRVGLQLGRVPEEALARLVGVMGDGSPLRPVLLRYGEAVVGAVSGALVGGLGMGANPRDTAREMAARIAEAGAAPVDALSDRLGSLRYQTERIARQETLRAYRGASLESYQANRDVLDGWEWSCSRDRRTCPVCWAMDGTVHRHDDPFASHVMCRCSPLPWFEGVAARTPGEVGFARLPAGWQEDVLGPRKFELYRRGEIQLRDLVHEHDEGPWGLQRTEANIAQALAAAGSRR